MEIDNKKVLGSLFRTHVPTSWVNIYADANGAYCYKGRYYGDQLTRDIAYAEVHATEQEALRAANKEVPSGSPPKRIATVQLHSVTKKVYRCSDYGHIEEAMAPIGYKSSSDWKTNEGSARKAAVRRVKRKIEVCKKKFENTLKELNEGLSRIEPTSVIFLRSLEEEAHEEASD